MKEDTGKGFSPTRTSLASWQVNCPNIKALRGGKVSCRVKRQSTNNHSFLPLIVSDFFLCVERLEKGDFDFSLIFLHYMNYLSQETYIFKMMLLSAIIVPECKTN